MIADIILEKLKVLHFSPIGYFRCYFAKLPRLPSKKKGENSQPDEITSRLMINLDFKVYPKKKIVLYYTDLP